MKTSKKLLMLALSSIFAIGACAFAACGETVDQPDPNPEPGNNQEEPVVDFSAYSKSDFLAEDFSSKKVSYQLSGLWDELPDYLNGFAFLYNMYDDGSLKVDQVNIYSGNIYSYYGFWEESNGALGHSLSADTLYMTNVDGTLIDKALSNTFYEEDGGSFSDKFQFDIAPGQFGRDVILEGGKTVNYATTDDIYQEYKKVVLAGKYVSKEAAANGISAEITVYSDGSMNADLIMAPHGVINHQSGTRTLVYENSAVKSVTYTFAHHGEDGNKDSDETVITVAGDAETFVWKANFMGNEMSFEMIKG